MLTLTSHESVTLTWTDPGDETITVYLVLRGPDAAALTVLVDNTVAAETTYVYSVRARNAAGLSPKSSPVSVTTLAAPVEEVATRSEPSGSDGCLSYERFPNSFKTTCMALMGETANGRIDSNGDGDLFAAVQFTFGQGNTITVRGDRDSNDLLDGAPRSTCATSTASLTRAINISTTTGTATTAATATMEARDTGVHDIEVSATGSNTGSYSIAVSRAKDLRKCLKSVLGSSRNVDMGAPKVVFHEQREISKRPERQRMATLGTVAACSQTSRPADQIPAQGGGERYSLCVAHRMRMANAPSRPASVAHHVPLLPHLAWRWDHGADT